VNLEAAASYAQRHALDALLVQCDGNTVFERYGEGFDAHKPHALYSGAKSFWGVLAGAAQDDGLLTLDERVGQTFEEWNAGLKAEVTLRQLLSLTSGIGFGGLGAAVPSYEKALASELKNEPAFRCKSSARFWRTSSRRAERARRTTTCASGSSIRSGSGSRRGERCRAARSRCRPAPSLRLPSGRSMAGSFSRRAFGAASS